MKLKQRSDNQTQKAEMLRLLTEAEIAITHLENCGACGEDTFNACPGGQHALAICAAIRDFNIRRRKKTPSKS